MTLWLETPKHSTRTTTKLPKLINEFSKVAGYNTNIEKFRKWQSTPVFLPGKFHGQRSLAGYSPWGCKELDTTEHLNPSWANIGLSKREIKKAIPFTIAAK